MSIDVYTKRAIVVDTSEHIIPSFLGGRLETRGLIDESTNGAFGRGIEAAPCRELQCFRAMVDGVTDREHASARAVVLRGEDGARYLVAGDGSVSRVPTAPKSCVCRTGCTSMRPSQAIPLRRRGRRWSMSSAS